MKRFLPLIILSGVILLYIRPFFHSGYFPTHDGEWAIIRLAEMYRELKDFQLPPRWSDFLNHGYGYPLFLFTYPFPYYLGFLLTIAGFGFTQSIKILFILSVFASGLFMYFLGKKLAGRTAGLIAAILYTVAPFRQVDLYVRGSIGESLSFALFPLMFLLTINLVTQKRLVYLFASSITLAVLILTHNISALIFFPFWIIFFYVSTVSSKENVPEFTLKFILPPVLLGLGLSAYFFIPALLEKKYIILSQIKLSDIKEHFVSLKDLINSNWTYGIKPSFKLGVFHIAGFLLSFMAFLFADIMTRKKYFLLNIYLLLSVVVLLFLANSKSELLWAYPPLSWIDFPWRFLGPLTFFISLYSIFITAKKITAYLGLGIVLISTLANISYAKPSQYFARDDEYYLTNDATTTSMDELMPVWVVDKPTVRPLNKVELEDNNSSIANLKYNSKSIQFTANAMEKTILKINSIYFPGWKYAIDGYEVPVQYDNAKGITQLQLPAGRHTVIGIFSETKLRLLADIISLISFFSLFAIYKFKNYEKN